MGMLERFTSIIKANINELLDRAEDPEKTVDQYLRDIQDDLAQVKQETAGVMAEEARAQRMVNENNEEVAKYDKLARTALQAGEEDDARTFLTKKQEYVAKGVSLQQAYDAARENSRKMQEMHDKLVSDVQELQARREAIKAKTSVAKTQAKVTEITGSASKAESSREAFERMEAKADQMLDQANAIAELDKNGKDPVVQLEDKYSSVDKMQGVEDELAKMKLEMGIDQ